MPPPQQPHVPSAYVGRRDLLLGAGALALTGAGLSLTSLTSRAEAAGTLEASPTADEYTALRDLWCDILTGVSQIDPGEPEFATAIGRLDDAVRGHLDLLVRSGDRTKVFEDADLSQTTDAGPVTTTYTRLREMAVAWFTPGSAYHQDADLLADVLAGLETTNELVYHDGRAEFENWWDWQIGSSRALADCLVLLEGKISTAARDRYVAAIEHFVPDPHYRMNNGERKLSTGANRVDLCQAAIVAGIASRKAERVKRGADGLPDVCKLVDSGDGWYADGSFIQHQKIAYTGTYGMVLLDGLARLLALLADSTWAVTDPQVENLYGFVDNGFAPVLHDGRMMDFVRGRAIARPGVDHADGHGTIGGILRLAAAVDAETAARWRSRCRGWLERDTFRPPYHLASVPRVALVSALLNGATKPSAEPDGSVVFRNMDRAVHRRAGWAYAISMYSKRVANYEYMNGDNRRGWHTGSGMTYLYDGDGAQFSDGFWPTVNPYRLPGTTVEVKTLADGSTQVQSEARWAGGPVLDGKYAAVGLNLHGPGASLRAKKSWFCLDDYVVAVGGGIVATGGNPVESVVENRNLGADGLPAFQVDGTTQPTEQGWSESFSGAKWAHLEGVAGYVFPGGATVEALREERTGSFADINDNGSKDPITRRYLTLWFDHGKDPSQAAYAYLVVPKATPARTAELAEAPGVEILANTTKLQAIQQPGTGITMANFWSPGTAGTVTVDQPSGVVVREADGRLSIAVAEPTRQNLTVRVQIEVSGYQLESKDPEVTVVGTDGRVTLDVRTGRYGKPIKAVFTSA